MSNVVSIVIAIVSLIGSVTTAGITGYMQFHTDQRKRRAESESVMAKYRDPLFLSLQALQSRLYNILDNGMNGYIQGTEKEQDYLLWNTCFVFGQYFAWVHILRINMQFLGMGNTDANSSVTRLFGEIRRIIGSDQSDLGPLMIWSGEQDALGEIMTVKDDVIGQHRCMGYAAFMAKVQADETFKAWFQAPKDGLESICRRLAPDARLRILQNLLVVFLKVLDPKHERIEKQHIYGCRLPDNIAPRWTSMLNLANYEHQSE